MSRINLPKDFKVNHKCIQIGCDNDIDEYGLKKQQQGIKAFRFCMNCKRYSGGSRRWYCKGCHAVINQNDVAWNGGLGQYFCGQNCPEQKKRQNNREKMRAAKRRLAVKILNKKVKVNVLN